ncbi:uncharacterized protein N7479_009113 [Penicillium vulpinum]|uniref:Uncharacterized protein n=1 Tax=Penicillium vulpinum TaxID=29845 RepID=A0A1V6RWU7_9EURO|nr:uncharacterized protein N7479_009113 [Penicillium vulpinum]KAJ5950700.1 hypothetical protein N7479_009113 [Penicillium vulpinum]OQE05883.1 hypothetical protein PENVUL_c021G06128 [Penicillium vulpinum]
MPRYTGHSAYHWYISQRSKLDLQLPPLPAPDTRGYTPLFLGERFCRAPDCAKETPATSTNNLRKHYSQKHPNLILNAVEGRPTTEEEGAALRFYVSLRDTYDTRVLAKQRAAAINKPKIPRKKDGSIHLTDIRKKVKDLHGQVPCEPCKDTNDRTGCCREENISRCDNFDYFDSDNQSELSDPPEEEAEEQEGEEEEEA